MKLEHLLFALTAIQAVYAVLTYHRDRAKTMEGKSPKRPIFIIGLFLVLTWSAVGFDYYDRHRSAQVDTVDLIPDYGWNGGAIYMSVNGNVLAEFADKYKLLFIARTSFANIDRMTDPLIAKSGLYTITPGAMALAIRSPRLRINSGELNLVEFNLVLVPNELSPDHILSLADVRRVGGQIIAARGKSDVLNGVGEPGSAATATQGK